MIVGDGDRTPNGGRAATPDLSVSRMTMWPSPAHRAFSLVGLVRPLLRARAPGQSPSSLPIVGGTLRAAPMTIWQPEAAGPLGLPLKVVGV